MEGSTRKGRNSTTTAESSSSSSADCDTAREFLSLPDSSDFSSLDHLSSTDSTRTTTTTTSTWSKASSCCTALPSGPFGDGSQLLLASTPSSTTSLTSSGDGKCREEEEESRRRQELAVGGYVDVSAISEDRETWTARRNGSRRPVVIKRLKNATELELLLTARDEDDKNDGHIARLRRLFGQSWLVFDQYDCDAETLLRAANYPPILCHKLTQQLMFGLAGGLLFLHRQRVAHRRLRLRHLLLNRRRGGAQVRLCGLGRCLRCPEGRLPLPAAGADEEAGQRAPELAANAGFYNPFAVDCYAMGLILGRMLLMAAEEHKLIKCPKEADLLYQLLSSRRPNFRPTAAQVYYNEWVRLGRQPIERCLLEPPRMSDRSRR